MRPFRELSRKQRLYRFRKLAQVSLRAFGLSATRLTLLQYGENVIYRVDLPDGSFPASENSPYRPDRCVLRLHAWDNIPYITSELIWLDALAAEAGLPVPAPLRTPAGDFYTKAATDELPQGRCTTVLRWLDGRKLSKGLRPVHLAALGRRIAQLHRFSQRWQPPPDFDRPAWDWEAQLGGSLFDVTTEELVSTMPRPFREPFMRLSGDARQAMASLGMGLDAFGLIHADLYPENVLFKAGRAHPIDFEDCGYGYWIWDIAVALCTWAWDDQWKTMRDAFYEGYSLVRTLPAAQWQMLDLFVATQFATMLLWASAFLRQDPKRADEYIPWRDESGNHLMDYFDRH